jgi:hypothetical protein
MGHNGNQVTRLRTMLQELSGAILPSSQPYLLSDGALQHER